MIIKKDLPVTSLEIDTDNDTIIIKSFGDIILKINCNKPISITKKFESIEIDKDWNIKSTNQKDEDDFKEIVNNFIVTFIGSILFSFMLKPEIKHNIKELLEELQQEIVKKISMWRPT